MFELLQWASCIARKASHPRLCIPKAMIHNLQWFLCASPIPFSVSLSLRLHPHSTPLQVTDLHSLSWFPPPPHTEPWLTLSLSISFLNQLLLSIHLPSMTTLYSQISFLVPFFFYLLGSVESIMGILYFMGCLLRGRGHAYLPFHWAPLDCIPI